MLRGQVRTQNTAVRPDWSRPMKSRTIPLSFTIDGEVSDMLTKNIRDIKFRYGSMSQYINYLLAKDLGLLKEEPKEIKETQV
jgi:hypothetical protein